MKPVLLFDGDCAFCRRWIGRWKAATGERVDYIPYQEAASRFPQVPQDKLEKSVVLIESQGQAFTGAEAVFRTLSYSPDRKWLFRLYRQLPGFRWASELVYRFVARNRRWLSRLI